MKTRALSTALWAALTLGAATAVWSPLAGAADMAPGPNVNQRLALARKAIDIKDWNRAMFELDQAVRDEPRNADVHNLMGYAYRKRSSPDLPKAFEHYKTALQIDPRHKGAHEYIGEAYLMDRKPAEAQKHLVELEKICGKNCEEYEDLAKAIGEYKARNPG